jgi:hypothetical protein
VVGPEALEDLDAAIGSVRAVKRAGKQRWETADFTGIMRGRTLSYPPRPGVFHCAVKTDPLLESVINTVL